MLRRLLAFLLLFALSAPAVALSGHCTAPAEPAPVHATSHHHGKHQAPAQAERGDCIGCVLPDLGTAATTEPTRPMTMIGAASPAPALGSALRRPDIPPPRA